MHVVQPTGCPTQLGHGLVQAYIETEYRVFWAGGFVLHIGRASAELSGLHRKYGAACSAYLTAWNPLSQELERQENDQKQAALREALLNMGLVCLDGIGQHPSNEWPGEESLLAVGLELYMAREMGSKFGQNALVWCGADCIPQLILLR